MTTLTAPAPQVAVEAPSRVLMATDLSRPAKRAARYLARLPFPSPPAVRLTKSVELPPGSLSFCLGDEWPPLMASCRDAADAAVAEEATVFADLTQHVSTSVLHGSTAEELLAEAGRFRADLVVVGAVGHNAVERALLGSTSDRLATHAACPVLVVRGTADPDATVDELDATGGDAGAPDRPPRLLIGCDGSAGGTDAAYALAGFDWPEGTRVTLLSLTLPDPPEWAFADSSGAVSAEKYAAMCQAVRDRCEGAVQAASTPFRERGYDVRTEVAETDHVGEALCDRAAAEDADLLVVADRGRNLWSRFLVGSTSRFVLRHSARPVWLHRSGRG
ncbi:universal stress protein [Alienimonas chondri]|uniref:UspA domain-containing protein n=1 Tax=Alienimonas chondri TaxID=2681879 RepID=A0ABX1VCR8_9PLAN|nr:universal stress protein [Alienimonas chondri]NNJ25914.1 hypothetical protein [Alienimonas chondri]